MSMQRPEDILQRVEWTVLRRLDGILQGDYRSLFRGFGIDLADLREYQFNDDIRYIDWNVTARMQVPYIRQYFEDREIGIWFLLDLSPSVDFGTAETSKHNLLVDFVASLARLLTRRGNRVGAILYTDRVVKLVPAQGSKRHVLRLIRDVMSQPSLQRAPLTELNVLIETGLRAIRRRSLVFIVSDFIGAPGWDRPLGMLTERHEVIAVRLYDPREVELPDIGPIFLQDSETGEQLYVDTHDKRFRARFIEAANRREYDLKVIFARCGIDLLSLSTEGDMVTEISKFAGVRKLHKKMSSGAFKPATFQLDNIA